MATGLFKKAKNNLGTGTINLLSDDIVVILTSSEYTPDLDDDEFQLSIPVDAVIAEKSLTGKTFIDGVFDADDITFFNLFSLYPVANIILAKNTGAVDTSILICNIDNALSLPLLPDGTDFVIQWSNSDSKIFEL